jgi:hypothetical protein
LTELLRLLAHLCAHPNLPARLNREITLDLCSRFQKVSVVLTILARCPPGQRLKVRHNLLPQHDQFITIHDHLLMLFGAKLLHFKWCPRVNNGVSILRLLHALRSLQETVSQKQTRETCRPRCVTLQERLNSCKPRPVRSLGHDSLAGNHAKCSDALRNHGLLEAATRHVSSAILIRFTLQKQTEFS